MPMHVTTAGHTCCRGTTALAGPATPATASAMHPAAQHHHTTPPATARPCKAQPAAQRQRLRQCWCQLTQLRTATHSYALHVQHMQLAPAPP